MNELILTKGLTGLPDSKATQIETVFQPMVKKLKGFESAYNKLMAEEQTQGKCERARELRLEIAATRIGADKARKEFKKEFLQGGRAVDGICHTLIFGIGNMEQELKDVENFYRLQKEECVEKIQAERESELAKYDVITNDPHFGVMADEVWVNYLAEVKLNYEAIKEAERRVEKGRIEAERKAKLFQERKNELAPYIHWSHAFLNVDTTQSDFDSFLLKMKKKKKEDDEERERITKENEILKAKQEQLEQAQKERERIMQEQEDKRQQEMVKQAAEEKKLELAPDKEKLLNFAEILFSKKDSIKSAEAKRALSQSINILADAANKM